MAFHQSNYFRAFVGIVLFFALFRLCAPLVFQYMIQYVRLIVSMASKDEERVKRAEEISWEMEYQLHEMDMRYYQQKCKEDNRGKEPYAWLTAMLNDNYAIGAIQLGHMLKKLSCYHKLIVLVSDGVTPGTREALRKVGFEVKLVEALDCNWMDRQKGRKERNLGLPGTFMRFHAWNYTQYKKIMYLDSDVVPVVSVDELFDLETDFNAAYCARPGIIDPCFNAGIILFKPSTKHYNGLMNLWGDLTKGTECPNDQVLLWHYYADHDMWNELPYAYNVRRYLYHPLKIYHFACCLTKKPWQVKNKPTRQDVAKFKGPFKEPWDMVILWWRYFYQALDEYKLNEWYNDVKNKI
ncbi:glycogenin-1-like [Clytia hemisphaerica]|uniref:glycogenin-1-like n=1 Tax=Clytia hemisphaerica TaxID=252671 RepID=UPI0034D411E4|eukprot:TCONS_00056774-protein